MTASTHFYHRSLYPIIAAIFCALLLISNIGATKFINIGFIKTDGGAFLFPLTYILGDVLTEVYGFRAAHMQVERESSDSSGGRVSNA